MYSAHLEREKDSIKSPTWGTEDVSESHRRALLLAGFLPGDLAQQSEVQATSNLRKKSSNMLIFTNWFHYHFPLKFFNFNSVSGIPACR